MSAKILFVCPRGYEEARLFAVSLSAGLKDLNIKITESGLTTRLFEIKKHDIVHFFHPGAKKTQMPGSAGGKMKTVQTLVSSPDDLKGYGKILFGDHIVTFSNQEHARIKQHMPDAKVSVIGPCVSTPAITSLQPSAVVREKYQTGEKLLVVALNDFRDQEHFSIFLYTAREYQRREGFRFLIPAYRQDRQSVQWRNRLKAIIEQEKLSCTTLLDSADGIHSLIDSADLALYISKRRDPEFEFPLRVVEALCAGKPVIPFDTLPVSEAIALFNKNWIARAAEDYSRISRDILKQALKIEEISTEVARYARARFSVDKVAEQYRSIYKSLLEG